MTLSSSEALLWTGRLIAGASLIQTLEFLKMKSLFHNEGIWDWKILRKDFKTFPKYFQLFFNLLLQPKVFLPLLWLRLIVGIIAIVFINPIIFWVLLFTTVMICLRWRGTFNGGSDFMTLIVLIATSLALTFPETEKITSLCLTYIAIQACASYFIAGLAKLKSKNWRQGFALPVFLETSIYDQPNWINSLLKIPRMNWLSSWGIILFECTFPAMLIYPDFFFMQIGAAILFHIGNAYFLGLNRFLSVWISTYPALLFFCLRVN